MQELVNLPGVITVNVVKNSNFNFRDHCLTYYSIMHDKIGWKFMQKQYWNPACGSMAKEVSGHHGDCGDKDQNIYCSSATHAVGMIGK